MAGTNRVASECAVCTRMARAVALPPGVTGAREGTKGERGWLLAAVGATKLRGMCFAELTFVL